jgi:hypothetical protein
MIATLEKTLEAAASQLVGNWQEFDCFSWHDKPDDAEKWCIVYTDNRDSGILDKSNAEVIRKELSKFPKTAKEETHRHWACGFVNGWSIKVYNNKGRITRAFQKFYELWKRLEDYPILDEELYSQKEAEEIESAWADYIRSDFEKALEKQFSDNDFVWPDNLRAFFDEVNDAGFEVDEGGVYVNFEKIVDSISFDDVAKWAVCYVVTWNDPGEEKEEYSIEYEAIERVEQLRAAGFIGACYVATVPEECAETI